MECHHVIYIYNKKSLTKIGVHVCITYVVVLENSSNCLLFMVELLSVTCVFTQKELRRDEQT